MTNFSVWSRSRSRLEPPFFCLESVPESAPGLWAFGAGAGAAQKSGGSATLFFLWDALKGSY